MPAKGHRGARSGAPEADPKRAPRRNIEFVLLQLLGRLGHHLIPNDGEHVFLLLVGHKIASVQIRRANAQPVGDGL